MHERDTHDIGGQPSGSVDRALDVARNLVRCGVPVFVAEPDPTKPIGFALPRGWEHTAPSLTVVNRWHEGAALCAVMGHTIDLVDLDPRNAEPQGRAAMANLPAWPRSYATAVTPSGGAHLFIASLHVGSKDNVLPGVDVKGGYSDGTGRGFAFIAPTVRRSKVDGIPRAYGWMIEPDLGPLLTGQPDDSGSSLAALIARSRPTNGVRPARGVGSELDLFRPPARAFTVTQAWEFVRPHLDALARARSGSINTTLNAAAKALSHFGDDFWPHSQAVTWLMDALSYTEYDGRTWRAEATIRSAYDSAERDWRAEVRHEGAPFPGSHTVAMQAIQGTAGSDREQQTGQAKSRRVELGPWLDGTYEAPTPSLGVVRDDGATLLYPGKWHTVVGGTGAGKTWLGLAHVADEIRHGRTVVYAHFEETNPAETIARLRALGVAKELISERFVWFDCSMPWGVGEFAEAFAAVWPAPSLVVLDGINAACTRHGEDPVAVKAVGWYRAMFVTPAAMNGAAVLSLGHPPKARDRQSERFGYGSTAWLDEVDGVGFRLVAHSAHPIRKGATGSALLYSVKDRAGSVELTGRAESQREGWVYLGSLVVDNATDPEGGVRLHMSAPGALVAETDPIDALAEMIVESLKRQPDQRYESQKSLEVEMRADGHKFDKNLMEPALTRLMRAGLLERDPENHSGRRVARAGWLVIGQLAPCAVQGAGSYGQIRQGASPADPSIAMSENA